MMATSTALRSSRLCRSDRGISFERGPGGRGCRTRACAQDGGASVRPGARVRVTEPVRVYHVPKAPKEGTDLQGLQGDVVADVRQHEKIELSANFPWKVRFQLEREDGDKPTNFFVHMREDEFEVIQ